MLLLCHFDQREKSFAGRGEDFSVASLLRNDKGRLRFFEKTRKKRTLVKTTILQALSFRGEAEKSYSAGEDFSSLSLVEMTRKRDARQKDKKAGRSSKLQSNDIYQTKFCLLRAIRRFLFCCR
jgi:hypothetical protein